MTENTTDETRETETETKRTLGEMSHTNPFTDESFGSTQTYQRGRMVAADGGEASGASRPSSGEDDESDGGEGPEREREAESDGDGEVLRDVEHTPPEGAESANRVHERGEEYRDEDVPADE